MPVHPGTCLIDTQGDETAFRRKCVCSEGYKGSYCEVTDRNFVASLDGPNTYDEETDTLYAEKTPCAGSNPCKHGECFLSGNAASFKCKCDEGYMGTKCQHREARDDNSVLRKPVCDAQKPHRTTGRVCWN